ncbi:MAG: TetR/AcrR family transcriptional regulator [Solirubrobacterales bacterium]|nr:MAG: TetR/AcrR family transcriptional regulator [Solirubrobacterales bacterium]
MSETRHEPPAGVSDPAEVPPHIVDAARHVLAQDGLAAATLQRISATAGVSRMTLHRRGVSKQDILRAIAEGLEADYREAIWPALVGTGTGAERLAHALELVCGVTERNSAMLEALSASSHDANAGAGALTRPVFTEPLARLLLDGAADGSLAELDPQETATVLFNLVGHTYRHLRAGHRWSARRAREGVIALVMGGVVARE